MLRLVHPPPTGGQATRPPKGRKAPALSLTDEELRHLRAATRNAVRAYGSPGALAAAIGVPTVAIYRVTGENGRRPCAGIALRIARASGVALEVVLGHRAALTEAGRCQACGSRIGAGRAAS
jgi:hypothetical protein